MCEIGNVADFSYELGDQCHICPLRLRIRAEWKQVHSFLDAVLPHGSKIKQLNVLLKKQLVGGISSTNGFHLPDCLIYLESSSDSRDVRFTLKGLRTITPADCNGALVFYTSIPTVLYIFVSPKVNLHGVQLFLIVIQSPGVSNKHTQGSSTCINRTSANDRLADRLISGHYWSKENYAKTIPYGCTALATRGIEPNWLLG